MPQVTKAELAKIIGVSLPTMTSIIARYPDMPVERQGRSGEAWQFDADAVVEFLRVKRAEEAEEEASRADLLSEMRLPFDEEPSPNTAGLTPTQQLAAVRTRMLLAKEAREAGHLVPVTEVRMALSSAVSGLSRSLDTFPTRIGRRHNLPASVVEEIAKDLEGLRIAFVRGLGPYSKPDAVA
nr:terminase small subunit [uncultured Roseococcus sp.]